MVQHNIEDLIEKYNNAETTLEEEATLQAYFTSATVAPHLAHYAILFQYVSQSQKEQYTKDVPLHAKKTTRLYQWISVAAATVLIFGLTVPQFLGPSDQKKQDALLVYNQTMEALSLVSQGINEGKLQLSNLTLVTENINQGAQQALKLGAYTEITNRILKKNNN